MGALAFDLLAPLRPGDAIAAGLRWLALRTDLGLVLQCTLDGRPLSIELVPRAAAHGHRVFTEQLAVGHLAGTSVREPSAGEAIAACEAVAAHVATRERDAIARARLGAARPRVRSVAGGRALHDCGDHYALSPYRGCTIGCRFCYAQSRWQPWRALLQPAGDEPWGTWVDACEDAPSCLQRELEQLPPRPIKLCPIVADPYQPIERRLRLTRLCLEVIAAASRPWPTLVLTRSDLVRDDLALLQALPRAWLGVSLPTADDEVRAHFEPRAATVAARVQLLRDAAAAGLRTFAVVQPLLPGPIDALCEALQHAHAGVAIGTLEGEQDAGPLFDAPRYRHARSDDWQRAQAQALRESLARAGVPVWHGELPPECGDP
ncbi:MAG: hypothetical protein K1X88_16745 [Nannocystaceae bacterium]|nr:hypothetical protein [Nannocystaceae bacterium]